MQRHDNQHASPKFLTSLYSLLNPFHLTFLLGNSLPLLAGILVIPSNAGRVWLIESLVLLTNFLVIIGLIQLGFAVVKWGVLDRSSSRTTSRNDAPIEASAAGLKAKGNIAEQLTKEISETKNNSSISVDSPLFSRIIIVVGGLLTLLAIALADYRAPYSPAAKVLIFIYITTVAIQLSLGSRLKPLAVLALKALRLTSLILASAAFVNGAFILRFLNLLFILFPLIGILLLQAGGDRFIAKKRGENLCLAFSALGIVFATFPPITNFRAILPPGFLIFLGFPLVFDLIRKRNPQYVSDQSYNLLAHAVNLALFTTALLSERGLSGM